MNDERNIDSQNKNERLSRGEAFIIFGLLGTILVAGGIGGYVLGANRVEENKTGDYTIQCADPDTVKVLFNGAMRYNYPLLDTFAKAEEEVRNTYKLEEGQIFPVVQKGVTQGFLAKVEDCKDK
jgi:hypothetical protein